MSMAIIMPNKREKLISVLIARNNTEKSEFSTVFEKFGRFERFETRKKSKMK
jgi:hypothetical protein